MSTYSFKTPDLGEGIVEVEVLAWNIGIGDEVHKDQPIADVMTDKANIELTSPVDGRVLSLACDVDERVRVGSELVLFDLEQGQKSETDEQLAITQSAAEPERISRDLDDMPEPLSERPLARLKVKASPAVRRQARALGIRLEQVRATGSHHQVTHADLERYKHDSKTKPLPSKDRAFKLGGLRRHIAQKMQLSASSIPHFSYVEEVDITALESLRADLNRREGDHQPHLTLTPFLMQAIVRALKTSPRLNATFDDEAGIVTRHNAVHMGIATQTDDGLKVPVIRDAQHLDIWGMARQLVQRSREARENRSSVQDLTGSTITITSLGRLGGIVSTPIINKPEVAIIGVNRVQQRVVVIDGQMMIRSMMNLSSSFDHRIIDGYDAAAFIQRIRQLLEQPALLFMPSVDNG